MASLVVRGAGRDRRYTVRLFRGPDQRYISLGRVERAEAQAFCFSVEGLIAARKHGAPPAPRLAAWVASLPDELHGRLAGLGLVPARVAVPLLGTFLADAIATAKVKPRTRVLLTQTRDRLVAAFGHHETLAAITPERASQWYEGLAAMPRRVDQPVSASEPRLLREGGKRLHGRNARWLFGEAVRRGYLAASPMAGLDAAAVAGAKTYIPRDQAEKVLTALPSTQLRTLVGLCRWAGLRPSEAFLLPWRNVDFERLVMRVYSPKAHRYQNGRQRTAESATRKVPIAPELARLLAEALEEASNGVEGVLTISPGNVAREVRAAIRQAGVKVWPRTFQSLRQSCETDWLDTLPAHVVAQCIGHTVAVQQKSYATVTDEHYARISGCSMRKDG